MDREDELDEQYDRLIILLEQIIVQLPKHQKIKMVAWIKKLDMPIKNEVWKENRNLYAQVMLKMMQQDYIEPPFDKNPPEGALPRLNISHLSYPLRNKIATKFKAKSVNRNLTQRSLNVKQNMTNNCKSFMETQETKKPSRSPIQSKSHLNSTFKFSISDQIQQGKELLKRNRIAERKTNSEQCLKIGEQLQQDKLCLVLKRTLKFLCKNHELLGDQLQYSELLQDIVSVGEQRNHNLRNIGCEHSPTRMVFKKCIRKIQEQIERNNQENQYYLNYLKECKPK